jgi:RNA polymerase sigma-70 factor (ECF subfamily)
VTNRALNARKARALRRADPLPLDYEAEGVSPEEDAERNEIGRRLAEAMKGLPERRQLIVRLFELEGFSSDEIGAMLDLPAGTVRWHLHEARVALRVALAPLKEGQT